MSMIVNVVSNRYWRTKNYIRLLEACGNSGYFRRISFRVTNGKKEKLKGVYDYLDDILICGTDQKDHDEKLRMFNEIVLSIT